jgi:gamma-glutamylcyclotransferase (GGCT)/AIG2-like uncharacterized protein YtfP
MSVEGEILLENVFCYGTLMFPQIMQKVTGISAPAEACRLCDFARYQVRGEVFPAIVPQAGEQIAGVVYRNLPPLALKRLDQYEGILYRRQRVIVETEQRCYRAWTYVIAPRYRRCLTGQAWDENEFKRKHLRTYLHRV